MKSHDSNTLKPISPILKQLAVGKSESWPIERYSSVCNTITSLYRLDLTATLKYTVRSNSKERIITVTRLA